MTKEIKQYISELEDLLNETGEQRDWERIGAEMLVRIGFYQHERLIHLIVTVTFALLAIISFCISLKNQAFILVAALFLILEIPYIIHYYFLENYVQKLYRLYYAVKNKII